MQQFNLGFQTELLNNLVVSVDAIHSFGSKFIIGRQIDTVFNPVIAGPDAIVNIESSVKTWFDGLLVNVQKRYSNRATFNASYTLSKTFNFSNDDQIPFQSGPINRFQLNLEKGPAPNDERHRFSFAGVFDLPDSRFRRSIRWLRMCLSTFDCRVARRAFRSFSATQAAASSAQARS